MLIIPQKPWNLIQEETEAYRQSFLVANGAEPPPPVISMWVMVDESADRAEEKARECLTKYWHSIVDHYEFDQPHLKSTRDTSSTARCTTGSPRPEGWRR